MEIETLEDEVIENENIVPMTLREFICLPRHSEYMLAKLQPKVGDRVRISNKQEELLQRLGAGEISKIPFLEITEVGKTGISSISFACKIADISEEE